MTQRKDGDAVWAELKLYPDTDSEHAMHDMWLNKRDQSLTIEATDADGGVILQNMYMVGRVVSAAYVLYLFRDRLSS